MYVLRRILPLQRRMRLHAHANAKLDFDVLKRVFRVWRVFVRAVRLVAGKSVAKSKKHFLLKWRGIARRQRQLRLFALDYSRSQGKRYLQLCMDSWVGFVRDRSAVKRTGQVVAGRRAVRMRRVSILGLRGGGRRRKGLAC